MAVLLDTRDLAPAERNDAVRHVIEFSSGPSFVGHDCPAERISGLMEYWQLGNAHILRSSDVGLRLSRNARELRKSAPEMLAVGIHLAGTGTFANGDVQQVVTPGDLYLNDMTASYEYAYAGAGATMAFVISYEQFGVPVDVARRANGRLAASPVHDLMTGHLARLCRTAGDLPDGPARAMLGTATIELMRALVSSARERLEGARRDLAGPRKRAATVAATAHRWGFAGPTHFSRRFRGAYGLSPREWRRLNLS